MRSIFYGLLLMAVLVAAIVMLQSDPLLTGLRELSNASLLVRERSVSEVSAEEFKYAGALGMVSVLDDYSTWHDRRSDTLIRREASGHYGGFGIEIVSYNDTTLIWQVFPGSPAQTAGLRMGDRLLAADTVTLVGLPLDSVHRVLQSIPHEEVDLRVFRPGRPDSFTVRSARGRIEVGTVRVWDRRDDVAYITLDSFNGETAEALAHALDTLTRSGVMQFILDLRGNPGGLLHAAVLCAELFLPVEGTVVSVTGNGPTEDITANPGPYPTQPLVLLVDEYSASGSELLAGCLQDWDRAVLIGKPTFGKGFVQNLFPLVDESSLRLTIGRYRTPSGRTFYRPDSTSAPDTAHYRSLVNGRPLVGGGQIFPDLQSPEPDCPDHLLGRAHSRGLFEFAVSLLARQKPPALDSRLLAEFWGSPYDDYAGDQVGSLAASLPDSLVNDPELDRLFEAARRAETEFDRRAATDCCLYVLARHFARGEASVPLLASPLLELDPALARAMEVLQSPGRYRELLTGAGAPASADRAGSD